MAETRGVVEVADAGAVGECVAADSRLAVAQVRIARRRKRCPLLTFSFGCRDTTTSRFSCPSGASLCDIARRPSAVTTECVRHSVDVTAILQRETGTVEKLLPSRAGVANLVSHPAWVRHRLKYAENDRQLI